MKIPIFASSYHSGNGLESRLSQSGVYLELHELLDSVMGKLRDVPIISVIVDTKEKNFILTQLSETQLQH